MKKRAEDWTTHLGGSVLPSDDFTFTDAGNGLLDGFSFDAPYNEGVLDGARLPESKGLSGLPDGLMASEDETLQVGFGGEIELNDEDNGSDLGTMLSFEEGGEDISPETSKAASLVNLDWLDPTQEQDPDRLPSDLLPDRPPLNSVPELEAAWGSNEPTTGISLIPARDLEAVSYEESIKEPTSSNLPGAAKTASEKQDAILRAVRRAHWGQDIRSILAELKMSVGDTKLGRQTAMAIKSDYGLAGKVFIRASAFPGLKNGKWVKELKKACRTAKYVITDDQMVADKLSMQMVSDVPWGRALREFTPWMHASGYRLASGNPKDVLRNAFLRGPIIAAPSETVFPEHHEVVASEEEAAEGLKRAANTPAPLVQSQEAKVLEKKAREAMARIGQLVKEQRLSKEDALRLRKFASEGVHPRLVLKAAALIMGATKTAGAYDGLGANLPKEAQLARRRVWADLDDAQSEILARESGKVAAYLQRAKKAGLLTASEVSKITSLASKPRDLRRLAEAAVAMAGKMRPERLIAADLHDYSGVGNENDRPMLAVDTRAKTAEEEALQKQLTQVRLAKWVQKGLLSKGAARAIWGSGRTASQMEEAGTLLVAEHRKMTRDQKEAREDLTTLQGLVPVQASETRTFIGPNYTEYAQADRVTKRADAEMMASRLEAARKKKVAAHLGQLMKQKLITAEDVERIFLHPTASAKDMEEEAAKIVATAKSGTYKGRIEKAAVMERRFATPVNPVMDRIAKAAKESGIKVSEFNGMLRWTRQQMSEGLVGKDLNDMMRAKFASTILKAAKDLIREVRAEHEGLSGHLYVDASAYATPNGTEGCDRGGLKHRNNGLKTVLAMPRCSSCTNNNADGFCSIYNKKLASKPPVEDPKAYQKEAIRMADAHDSEVTASLFNPGEFNLQNPLDNLALENETCQGQLEGVFFGGTELR